MDGTLRVLHLPDVIGGHPPALAKGERELGIVSSTLSCEPSVYDYPADIFIGKATDSTLKKMSDRWAAFKDVRNRYDVYHFNFGATLLNFPRYGAILPEIAYYGKRAATFMTWQGDDARLEYPADLDRSLEEEARRGRWDGVQTSAKYLHSLRALKRKISISRSAKHCNHMFALNPDLLENLPREKTSFLPYAIEPPNVSRASLSNTGDRRPTRFVHLSTSPVIKGTGLIEAAIEKAQSRAHIEFDIVIKRPRSEALNRLSMADYLIDQIVLGWYGGTAVEAMYLGVPVIGRICNRQAERAGGLGRELPVIRADADTLADVLVELACHPEQRPALAERSLNFAKKWHTPSSVAAQTRDAYRRVLAELG